jgi:hypothetical protein
VAAFVSFHLSAGSGPWLGSVFLFINALFSQLSVGLSLREVIFSSLPIDLVIFTISCSLLVFEMLSFSP